MSATAPFSLLEMFFSLFPNLLISSAVVADVSAKPLSPPRAGRIMPINRSFRQKPPVHTSSLPIFDPESVKRELRGLWPKYRRAPMYLNGIELTSGIDGFLDTIVAVASTEDEAGESFIPPAVLINTHTMPLNDYISGSLDLMYFGPVNFGTPPQKLTVDIDTGSGDLWIPVNCPGCVNRQFEDTKSSTCKNSDESFSVFYGSGEVSGTLIQDVVSMAGLEIEDQFFGAVSKVSDDFNGLPNDGLLGLAFGTISQSGKPTFFETLIKRDMLPAPMFSIHLSRNQESGSDVCFGCLDNLKTLGPVEWVPVLNQTYWSVSMDAVVFKSQLVRTELLAIIDSGTTLIYLPPTVADEVYAMIPNSKPAPQFGPEFYTYPCSTALNIAFSFDGRRFSISPLDFNLGLAAPNSPDCVGGILSLGSEGFPSNLAIVGDVFLKSWYTTFDYSGGGRVGFSPSINNR
ncbi:aspartic peptidase domain-containing protein [Mycena latifolia]|nr:aspartic peptidase domain-containing protein [Mycena latifolia]